MKDILNKIFNEIKDGNNLGEKITLVGATKFVDVEKINKAISLGLGDVGENKAQEFRDKYDSLLPCNYHFFGRLQKNKVKYLVGKVFLIHSVDSIDLISEIDKKSKALNVKTNILIEINMGEEQKGGVSFDELPTLLEDSKVYENVVIKGLMAVMENTENQTLLIENYEKLRKTYDKYKEEYNFEYLSCGMSNDYKIAIKHGSNMIRVGSLIFGSRY
ncbi:MAG: YggS family pyridoxal phosphate-dependent enzyme [Clostridia bacterium]|nr:YggS family pyridoxal phosphate-dependent enzyme [Clostridia bacterium]